MTTTFSAKPAEVVHEWFVIDATDKVLGRVASEVALRLRGKHKAIYTPHVDTGDFIVIINAAKLKVTGTKSLDKVYYRHSGYPGGITATNFRDMQAKHPGRALEKAVKGMLPKGPLGYAMAKKLKVYAGAEHPLAFAKARRAAGTRRLAQQVLLHALLVAPPLLERDADRVGHGQHLVGPEAHRGEKTTIGNTLMPASAANRRARAPTRPRTSRRVPATGLSTSPIVHRERSSPTAAIANKAAMPTGRSIRRSAFRYWKPPPMPTRNRS